MKKMTRAKKTAASRKTKPARGKAAASKAKKTAPKAAKAPRKAPAKAPRETAKAAPPAEQKQPQKERRSFFSFLGIGGKPKQKVSLMQVKNK